MAAGPRRSNEGSSAQGAAGTARSRLALSPQPLDPEAERRRRELDVAMEEELRQVTKTSQRPSEPWSPAEPPPREGAARSRRLSLPWIMALVVVILALSGVVYQGLRKLETTERTPAANPAGLGLKVEMKKNTVHVSWDKNAPLIASAKRATLSIKDGQRQNDLTLGADLLSRGSLNYYHKTKDITFHLQVVADGNRTTSEVVQLPRDNQGGAPLPAPVSIDSGRQRVGTVPPEVPSTGRNPGAFQGGFALAPQRLRKTAPQISPGAISAPPLEKREPAAIEKSPLDQATLKSTKAGVPQPWKLVVEYVGLTPSVSFQPEGTPNSSSLPMEGFSRAEDADALKSQAVTPPPDEPTPSHPKEMAKNAGVVEETPLHDSAVRDSVVAPTQAAGTDSTFRSVVQCPENSKVREVPFVSGRPDRKTVGCGEAVAVIREFGDWVRIRTRDGFEGHILRQYVK